MLATGITYFGKPAVVVCDGNCNKAWGINSRPNIQLSDDEEDYEHLADAELPDAPADPGTYEGFYGKPETTAYGHNKWCARECERSVLVAPGEPFELPDFSRRVRNKPDGNGGAENG